jgi:post-segregation antitoxin (ccd killing protein)
MRSMFSSTPNTAKFQYIFTTKTSVTPAYNVPITPHKEVKTEQINFRATKTLDLELKRLARERKMTVSALVYTILLAYITKRKGQ